MNPQSTACGIQNPVNPSLSWTALHGAISKMAEINCTIQWRIQGGEGGEHAPSLLLDQTEARRAEKKFLETGITAPLI